MRHLTRPTGVALAAIGIQALMVFAFTAPTVHSAPHKVPLAVSAPAPARAAIEQRLATAAPGAFAVREVADESAARAALTDREAYGAVVVTDQGPHMLIASAASPTVATLLTEVGSHLAPAGGNATAVPVNDVVPASAADPHGAAFTSMVLPLVMSSLIGGVLLTIKLPHLRERALGLLLFALGGGASVALIAGHALAFLPGSYLVLATAIAAPILTISAFSTATASLIGRYGFAVAGTIMMLLSNPLSAASSAPELLPTPWGRIGQDLPAGAAATLIRSVAFFHGHGGTHAEMVLGIWASAAALMLTAAGLRARQRTGKKAGGAHAAHGGHGAHDTHAQNGHLAPLTQRSNEAVAP
ncbi:hypothetical protein [Catenulispora rubra]|uniref:hypothetical protein n=1 Tax=Catenulispora rubra TaxID=280293 RepID=UPI0018922A19|nr:hypothetical protein [Catenulispora rubra]